MTTTRQDHYITYLETLIGIRTRGTRGSRIRQLTNGAKKRGIPEWRWRASPVRICHVEPQEVEHDRERVIDRDHDDYFFL